MNATKRAALSLVVLALLAFTLATVGFSGASVTSASINPANLFLSGDLQHGNSQSGLVMIRAIGMSPGDSSVGTMTLTGTGTLAGAFTLSASSLVNAPSAPRFSDALTLTVKDVTGTPTTLYQGSVSSFTRVSLGTIPPGAARVFRLTLTYPTGTVSAALQGATMSLSLLVTAVTP
jgi:hypothetical protein